MSDSLVKIAKEEAVRGGIQTGVALVAVAIAVGGCAIAEKMFSRRKKTKAA